MDKEIIKNVIKTLFECSAWKNTRNKTSLGKNEVLELDNEGLIKFKEKLKDGE